MKKIISLILAVALSLSFCVSAFAAEAQEVAIKEATLNATEKEQEELVEKAKDIAYLDLDMAPPEMKQEILEARKKIIYNTDWVADGYSGYIQDVETGEIIKELPEFSEVFPEWNIPVEKFASGTETTVPALSVDDKIELAPIKSIMSLDSWLRIVGGRLYLETASATENADPFTVFTVDPYEIGTEIRAYASSLTSSATCNIGISDYNSGASLGLATRLTENRSLNVFVGIDSPTVAVRASTYSTPGWATMAVDGNHRIKELR